MAWNHSALYNVHLLIDVVMFFNKQGATLASTWVTKPKVHAEDTDTLVNNSVTLIVANDDNYALAA